MSGTRSKLMEVAGMVPLFVLIIALAGLRGLGVAGVEALDGWQPALRGGGVAL